MTPIPTFPRTFLTIIFLIQAVQAVTISLNPGKMIGVTKDDAYIAYLSDNEKVVVNGTTIQLQDMKRRPVIIAERNLRSNRQPTKICALKHKRYVYVALVYMNSTFTEVCVHSYTPRRRWARGGEEDCDRLKASQSVSNMIVSLVVRSDRPYVYTVYVKNGQLIINDLLERHTRQHVNLPTGCTCASNQRCLTATNDIRSKVLISCANGIQLYDLYSEDHVDLPSSIKQVIVGNNGLAVLTSFDTDFHQDKLVTLNTETGVAQVIRGTPGSTTQPGVLLDLAIKKLNRSEFVFNYEQGKKEIFYFKLQPPGTQPEVKSWPLPHHLRNDTCEINSFRTVSNRMTLMIEIICQTKWLLPVTIEIEKPKVSPNVTGSQSGFTVCPSTVQSDLPSSTSSKETCQTVSVTVTPQPTSAAPAKIKRNIFNLIYYVIIAFVIVTVTQVL